MKKIILLFYFFRVCLYIQPVTTEDIEDYLSEINEDAEFEIDDAEILNGSLFKTVKKYYCKVDSEDKADILLYGTKSWTFPLQDVTLNLSYPSKQLQKDNKLNDDFEYVLTEIKVILQLDSATSKGYITDGGMLQDHISMAFVFSNITSLSYQFYIYGVPKNVKNITDNYTTLFHLC